MGPLAYLKTQFAVHLLIGFVFVVSGLLINSVQLCTLVLWPLSKQLYRRLNCRLAYSLWSQLVMLLEWWSCTECTLFTDQATVDRFGKEHVVVILNHNFEIDFLCGWTMCERFGVLGSSKVLAKRELLYVPLIGWTWYFLEIVFCKRRWEEDRDTVIRGLERLADYPEYMWFLLYCEGTRFTEKKHRVSMEVAASKGLPALKYHLLPRTKGFTTAVQCLRGTVAAVYDVTLNFRGNKNPSLLGILYGKKYEADMCVRSNFVNVKSKPGGFFLLKFAADWLEWKTLSVLTISKERTIKTQTPAAAHKCPPSTVGTGHDLLRRTPRESRWLCLEGDSLWKRSHWMKRKQLSGSTNCTRRRTRCRRCITRRACFQESSSNLPEGRGRF
uniref:Phospholipid/glycerol acyltransferase domain-containing protein n=1 Tax=Felis catus TaxID=9685 RepID=A0ABI7XN96_FELCA